MWKGCPETTIEHTKTGDALKVTWGDDITVVIEATYSPDEEGTAISVDVSALPHLVLALQHCMDVARLEGCYDDGRGR